MSGVIQIRKEIGGFDYAGARASGEGIRERIRFIIDEGGYVTLDFTGVDGISHSFADEILGVIVRAFGIEFIQRGNLRLNNANEDIKAILNFVIRESRKALA